jgi:hypothetical protein
LSNDINNRFFDIVQVAIGVNQDDRWVTSLSDLNDEELARAINEYHAMGEEGFKQYLRQGGVKTSTVVAQILRDTFTVFKNK